MTKALKEAASNVVSLPNREEPFTPHLLPPVLIPPGEYELCYRGHRLGNHYQRSALAIWFTVPEFGQIYLPRYYRVLARRKGSGFAPPRHGALVADFRRVFTRPLPRLDRFPVTWLDGVAVLGEVGTVTKDYEQNLLDDETRYSVVRKLIKIYG